MEGRKRFGKARRFLSLHAARRFPPVVHPMIRRRNLHSGYLSRARQLTQEWSRRFPAIEAVLLSGGVSRGYADEESELDLPLYLTPAGYRSWVLEGRSPIPEGDSLWEGTWIDVSLTTIAAEHRRAWEPVSVWDASFGKVLIDRRGRLRRLLREKVRFRGDPVAMSERYLHADWFVWLGGNWIDRTDAVTAHHVVTLAFEDFLSLLFEAQGEIPPYAKWRFHLSRSLRALPPRWESRAKDWMAVKSFTAADVQRRMRAARALLRWWRGSYPTLAAAKWADALRALRRPMDLREFRARFGESLLVTIPFCLVARVEGGRVHLDRAALARLLRQGSPKAHPYQVERLRDALGRRSQR